MAIRTRWFREYLEWRARMVSIAALAVFALLAFGFLVVVTGENANLMRLGILLQFLGALALTPDVVGRDTVLNILQAPTATATGRDFLRLYERKNLAMLLGNGTASLMFTGLLLDALIFRQLGTGDSAVVRILGMLGFAWLNLTMLLYIYRALEQPVPNAIYSWFFAVDLLMMVPGLVLSTLYHGWLAWLPKGLAFIFRNGVNRVLLIVTLPCFLVGLMFELIATFL